MVPRTARYVDFREIHTLIRLAPRNQPKKHPAFPQSTFQPIRTQKPQLDFLDFLFYFKAGPSANRRVETGIYYFRYLILVLSLYGNCIIHPCCVGPAPTHDELLQMLYTSFQ